MALITPSRRGVRVLATALGLTTLLAAPAHAAGIGNPYNCTPQATPAQKFAAWGDLGSYTPVLDAGVESAAKGWTLTGGAAVVAGNEPWKIGGAADRNALDLPAGSSAITAPVCIDETYPHFRLFARNTGIAKAALKIDVVYYDIKGNVTATKPYEYKTTSAAWQPTGLVGIGVFTPKTTVTAAPVAFRFTPAGGGARYQIDDVYVDPRMRS